MKQVSLSSFFGKSSQPTNENTLNQQSPLPPNLSHTPVPQKGITSHNFDGGATSKNNVLETFPTHDHLPPKAQLDLEAAKYFVSIIQRASFIKVDLV